ncbi:MAG: hypothetical protein AAF849_19850 [Bacteroidota bacterium]
MWGRGPFQTKGEVIAGFGAILSMACILLVYDPIWKLCSAMIALSVTLCGVILTSKQED